MNYQPLEGVPKNIQNTYFSNVLTLGKSSQELENLFKQYQNTYQEYVNTANNINKNEQWIVEKNVLTDFFTHRHLPETFPRDISQKDCITACVKDPHCDFILFSDSGNGACAANKCIKFSQQMRNIGDNKDNKTNNNSDNPFFKADPISIPNKACMVDNSGPSISSYSFNGWKKPVWRDIPNTTLNRKQPLGNAESLSECKNMALRFQNGGPYQYIEYTESLLDKNKNALPKELSSITAGKKKANCFYAASFENNLTPQTESETNSIVSIASQENAANMSALQNISQKLEKLNKEIYDKFHAMEDDYKKIEDDGDQYQNNLNNLRLKGSDFSNAYRKLENDRKVIQRLRSNHETQNSINESLQKNLKMKKSQYWFFEFLI